MKEIKEINFDAAGMAELATNRAGGRRVRQHDLWKRHWAQQMTMCESTFADRRRRPKVV